MINNYFDFIYLINLLERKDRLEKVDLEFKKYNINYNIFPAIKPKFSSLELNYYNNFQYKNKEYIIGQCGCKMSHLAIIEDAKKNNFKKILILEDDIEFKENPNDLLPKVLKQLDDKECVWDMLYFGGWYEHGGFYQDGKRWFQEWVGRNVQKLKGSMTTCGYALSNKIFNFILDNALNSGYEIDIFYYESQKFHREYNYFGIVPQIVVALEKDSDINKNKSNFSQIGMKSWQ